MARKPSETVQTSFRIKEGLRRQIEQSAIKRGVSFNAEISMRMKESFDRESLFTLDRVAEDMKIIWAKYGDAFHDAELFDQLITVTTALLDTTCTDAAVVAEAKALLNVIARAKRISSTGGRDGT
jgi:hypothetical protein